jgi:hypothetical protein
MDTKTLMVGQDVNLIAGCYGLDGRVVRIMWSHAIWKFFGLERRVYVQPYRELHDRLPPWQKSDYFCARLLRFDNEGKECGGNPLFEGGPWYIDRVSTEREQAGQKHQLFIEWWKRATYEQRLVLVTKYYTTRLAPPLRANFAPAEDIARIADISSDLLLLVELGKELGRER